MNEFQTSTELSSFLLCFFIFYHSSFEPLRGAVKSLIYFSGLSLYFLMTFLTSGSSLTTIYLRNGISFWSSVSSRSSPYQLIISIPLLGHVLQKFSLRLSIIIVFLISLPKSLRSLTLWKPCCYSPSVWGASLLQCYR